MPSTLIDLGKKIRNERQERQLTLEKFSQMTGLSKSFLSQVERGITEPSITSLKKIAKQFGFSVVNLFQNGDTLNSNWEYHSAPIKYSGKSMNYVEKAEVVRADKRKRFALPGSKVMYMRVSEGENSGEQPMLDPPGEKVGLVLKGSIEVSVGTEVYQLGEGDSIYYPANIPHSWRALEGDSIEVVWILTPPSF